MLWVFVICTYGDSGSHHNICGDFFFSPHLWASKDGVKLIMIFCFFSIINVQVIIWGNQTFVAKIEIHHILRFSLQSMFKLCGEISPPHFVFFYDPESSVL